MILEYPDDGRFFHGLALCQINRMYDLKKNVVENANEILSIIKYLQEHLLPKALSCYNRLLTDSRNELNRFVIDLVKKNISALYNTLADLSIRKYEVLREMGLRPEFAFLEEGRTNIELNKQLIGELGNVYSKYPVCNITEAELEYFEALHFKDTDRRQLALEKIRCAYKRSLLCEGKAIIYPTFANKINSIAELKKKLEQ